LTGCNEWVVCATDPRSPISESTDASLVSKASTRYPGCKPDTMKMSSIRFRTRRLVAGSRPPIARVPVAEYAAPVMCASDGEISRQVPPRGLGVCRGSTPGGQKELALLGQRKSKRGNGAAPAALPQDRPVVATRSVLSRGGDQGYGVIQLDVQEIPATG